MNILIENGTVVPMTSRDDAPFVGAIGISGDKITMVSREDGGEGHTRRVEAFLASAGRDTERIDARGMAVMPGMVNTHNHASMSLLRGYADDLPLFKWLSEYIWPFEGGMSGEDIRMGAELGVAEMLAGGTTTFADMYWMETFVGKAVATSGIRALLGSTCIDGRVDVFQQEFEQSVNDWQGAAEGRITLMVAPHAPYTCSPDTLRRCLELADKHGVMVYTHVAETLDEIETIRKNYGKTPVEYLRDQGVFDRRSVAVHCVHLTGGDMDIMASKGVTVAHNPQSNMKLASGIAPVKQMLEKGLTVGLGTDGPSSNNDLDMWEEMRSASLLQKVANADPLTLPAYDMLEMATLRGARTLHMEDKIGSLAEGKLADVILVDMRKPHLQPLHNVVSTLAYSAKASDVALTIVNGRIVAREGRCTQIDTPTLMATAQSYIERRAGETSRAGSIAQL